MENKKQLIIIPPMSEALKKLNEVLDGISVDENVEISIIDDLKELGQFVGSAGQCIILVSNAKKCAMFLQENRFVIAKHHCKVILFTPKEIPIKTLTKFTKIGLTESILENAPPKTLLYKVKLLLRSIKTSKPAEDTADKVVKSSQDGKPQENADLEVKEKAVNETQEVEAEIATKKKSQEEGETIDYGASLKGKIKPQEETIDTHWKSDRKKNDTPLEESAEEDMSSDSEQEAIDMYYRGKQKRTDDLAVEEAEEKTNNMFLEEAEIVEKKKASTFVDDLDEGSMKQKRLDLISEEEEVKNKKTSAELILEATEEKASNLFEEEEESLDLKSKKLAAVDMTEEEKESDLSPVDDLGGYLKGKITKTQNLEEAEEAQKDKADYDNSGLFEEEGKKDFDLDLEAADKKAKKKDIEGSEKGKIHEGEVDQIEGNMIGDVGTVDKIRTRMEGRLNPQEKMLDEDDEEMDLTSRKKLDEVPEDENEETSSLELDPAAAKEREKALKALEDDTELDLDKKSSDPLLASADNKREKMLRPEDEDDALDLDKTKIDLEKTEKERHKREALRKDDDSDMGLKDLDPTLDLEKTKKDKVHNGQVEKIDTFYRGGDSKKINHSWDNLVDKKAELDLEPGKTKRIDQSRIADARADLGEITIDYRKLKEEFEMIARDGSASDSGAFTRSADGALKNDEDEGSFKVVEIDPKSLDFAIHLLNVIYQKDIKAKQIFAMLASEIVKSYNGFPVFYTYKASDKKFTDAFISFTDISGDEIPNFRKEWWAEAKKDTALFEHFQSKSMTTWRCPEIVNNNEVWEDVELPTWAEQELTSKKVELIFPYFDGLDRMGLAVVFFPEGINTKTANGLLTALEMARTLFLDTIQRYQVQPVNEARLEEVPVEAEKKNVLSFFGGLFGKKKAS